MKKNWTILSAVLLLLVVCVLVLPAQVQAATYGSYTYVVIDGSARITDTNKQLSGNVVIPSTLGGYPVTAIGDYAFYNCTGITGITVPDSVQTIGEAAFRGCESLESISLPFVGADRTKKESYDGVFGYIFGYSAAEDTGTVYQSYSSGSGYYYIPESLRSVTVTDAARIPFGAFYGCEKLTAVTVSNSVEVMDTYAFYGCNALEEMTLPFVGTSRTENGTAGAVFGYIFGYSSSSGSDKVYQDYSASYSSTNYYYYIPSSLQRLTITDTEQIPYGAFYNCSMLKAVIIPDTLTSIDTYAFYNCSGITSLTIPDSVQSLSGSFISGCSSITSVSIGSGVRSIPVGTFTDFYMLERIDVSPANSYYSSQNGILFNKDKTTLVRCPVGKKLTTYTVPGTVTRIEAQAFYRCEDLLSVTVPDSVTSIGDDAFYGCNALEEMTLPFVGASRTENGTPSAVFGYIFGYSSSSGSNKVYQDYSASYSGTNYYFYIPSSLQRLTITDTEQIPYGAFYNCSMLKTVTIPDTLTSIDTYAFYNCTGLEVINYPGSKTDRNSITIGTSNNYLIGATWQYGKCIVEGGHTYTNSCDVTCDVCAAMRTVTHTYTNACDTQCNVCFATRVTSHTYTNSCDTQCNVCFETRTITHTYTSACDSQCNVCFATRVPEKHKQNPFEITNSKEYPFAFEDGIYTSTNHDHSSSATLTARVTVDCTIIIDYTTSTESYSDHFYIFRNGGYVVNTYGKIDWTTCSLPVAAGDTVEIRYRKDSSGSDGTDTVQFKLYVAEAELLSIDETAATCKDIMCAICYEVAKTGAGHSYTDDFDTLCNVCGEERAVDPVERTSGIYTYRITPGPDGGYITIVDVQDTTSGKVSVPSQQEGYSVKTIGASAFADCLGITGITLPDTVTCVEDFAFKNCSGLSAIRLPDGVQTIGKGLFSGCVGLLELEIPFLDRTFGYLFGENQYEISNDIIPLSLKQVKVNKGVIPASAFRNCHSISIVILGDGITAIGSSAFAYCNSITSVTIGNAVETVGVSAFQDCVSLTQLTIGSAVKTIDISAFQNCVSLQKVTVPDATTRLNDQAFYNCISLEELYLGTSLEHIGNYAFYNCVALKTLVIPDSTVLVGAHSFRNCLSLRSVDFGINVTTIFDYAFECCESLETVTLPTSITFVGEYSFANCTALTQAYIRGHVEHMNNGTFEGCTSLETVGFTKDIHTIAYNAFNGCTKLAKVIYTGTASEKNQISIAYGNDKIKNANWVYGTINDLTESGWVKRNGKWYIYENGALVKNAWREDSKGWVYLGKDGAMLTNSWCRDSKGWCYVGADGYAVTNCWKKDSVGWVYLDANGSMVYNKWVKDSVGWCYVGSDGYMVTNKWVRDSVGWCYIGANGYAVTNCWKQDSTGKWCHLNANGSMDYNKWIADSKGWCYVGADGYMVTNGWAKDSLGWYWMGSDGYAIKNTFKTIGGKTYYFNASGLCTNP